MLTALVLLVVLMVGATIGALLVAILAAGARADECQECVWRRQQLVEHWNDHAEGTFTAAGALARRRSLIRTATWRAAHRRN